MRAALSTGFIWEDDYTHLMISFAAAHNPVALLDVWGRPLMTLAYLPASVIAGDVAVRVTSLVLLLVTGALVWATVRANPGRLGPAAALLVIAQPMLAEMGFAALPGLVFSVVMAVSLWLRSTGRWTWATLVVGLLPLARLEGAVVVAVWCGFLVAGRRARLVPLAALGVLSWNAIGAFLSGDPLWLLHHNPYPVHTEYVHAGWLYIFRAAPIAFGPAILTLAALAFAFGVSADRLTVAILLAICVFYAAVWGLGLVGSFPTPTYLASAAVPMALVAYSGLARLLDQRPRPWWPGVGGVAVAAVLFVAHTGNEVSHILAALGVAVVIVMALRPVGAAGRRPAALAMLGLVCASGAFFTPTLELKGADRVGSNLAAYVQARHIQVARTSLPAFAWYNRPQATNLAPAGVMRRLDNRPAGYAVVWDSHFGDPALTPSRFTALGYRAIWTGQSQGTTVILWCTCDAH